MASTLCWLSITPLGSPVEPEEKSTSAVLSASVGRVGQRRSNGANLARKRHLSFVPRLSVLRMSSM